MLQFCLALQQPPSSLAEFVYDNINNEQILPLISQQQFLAKLELKLTKVEHAQFFIKNIFKILREPYQEELQVLKQFICSTCNVNLKKITIQLFEGFQKQQLSILNILEKMSLDIRSKNSIEVEMALKTKVEPKFQILMRLLDYLFQANEKRCWSNKQFKNKLNELIYQAFQLLHQYVQLDNQYLNALSQLFRLSMTGNESEVYFTLFLHNLLPNFKNQVIKIIKYMKNEQNSIFPNMVLSRGLFLLFQKIFGTQGYFDQQLQLNIQNLSLIAQQFYQILGQAIQSIELGWLSIFSLDKVVLLQQFEQKLHICASILRQVYNGRPDLIGEIYTLVVCNFIQKIKVQDNIQKVQSVLLMLNPCELKYLIFRLNNVLSQDKKVQIVAEGLKHPNTLLNACLAYFIRQLGTKLNSQEVSEFQFNFRESYKGLYNQIVIDRYNTYEKELQHFIKWHIFKLSHQISHFKLEQDVKLSDLLSFYKNLFQKDYFAEQFWINQQKMEIFLCTYESQAEKMDIYCQFFQNGKIFNLSEILLLTGLVKKWLKTSKPRLLSSRWLKMLKIHTQRVISILQQDQIPSNLLISLQYLQILLKHDLLDIKQNQKSFNRLFALLNQQKWSQIQQNNHYGRLNYSIQYLTIKVVEINNQTKNLMYYKNLLTCYQAFIQENGRKISLNNYTQKMLVYYKQKNFKPSNFPFFFRELYLKNELQEIMCNYPQTLSLKLAIRKSSQYFLFQSPTYKQEIVIFTYISKTLLTIITSKIITQPFCIKRVEKAQSRQLASQLFQISLGLLRQILQGDTFSHSATFYKSLIKSQNFSILLSNSILLLLDCQKLQSVFDMCLLIIQKDNYPLLRQYIQVLFCRTYLTLNKLSPNNNNRNLLLSLMKVNVNVGIPIALTLGYQLLQYSKSDNKQVELTNQINQIHELLVKFISCHTAYLRGICQYYLHKYLLVVPPSDPFLININKYWTEDKDSQKILTNISTVVEGFKEAVQKQADFIGFQRVQQYPSNRVKLQFYRSACRFYNESIKGQISQNSNVESNFFQAYCSSVQQRAQQIKRNYLQLLQLYQKYPNQRCHKNNMKNKPKQQEVKTQNNQKAQKKATPNKGKGKDKSKFNVIKKEKIKFLAETSQNTVRLQNIFQIFCQIDEFTIWCRRSLDPKVIVIATLLQKVHNFGHILRTLHGQQAMIVVPSKIPLEHPECKELVPDKCDVKIVQIKQRDLQKFIVLMKQLNYPLVALQQCSKSVKVEQAKFPQRFMLLLGNERLGAPAALLNEGDLLVEIPQVGKIRSLNVHVSMVICLWQFLTKQGSKK